MESSSQPRTTKSVIENCRYCLMCRHVCPVGHVTHRETLTPHGWGITIASVQRKLIEWNADTIDVLYSCADCGTCRAHCVTDQTLPDAINTSRQEVAALNLAPTKVYEIHQALEKWSNPYQKESPIAPKGQAKIALFVGDDARYLCPSVLENAIKLLEAIDIHPVLVGNGRNNGFLASSLGFQETARKLVQATNDEISSSGARQLLVLSPGDHYAFSKLLVDRLGVEWPSRVEIKEVISLLSEKFAASQFRLAASQEKLRYAYIDPTHALRLPARHEDPRKLLASALTTSGSELFWRKERTHPCGNGALQFTNPSLSVQLTRARLADAQQAGVEVVYTEDPGCLYHLNLHAHEYGFNVKDFYGKLVEQLV